MSTNLPSSLFIITINNYQLVLHLILLCLLPIFSSIYNTTTTNNNNNMMRMRITPISKTVKIKRLTKIKRKSKSSINMLSQYYIKHLWKK